MSQLAPFSDAARSVDPTNFSYSFTNYYPYGSAIALALDLELAQRSKGRLSLDDYMRAMWRVHGKPAGAQPGLVAKPYTLQDARDRLAEIVGRSSVRRDFFASYIEGREVPDYARAAGAGRHGRAQATAPGSAWSGATSRLRQGRPSSCDWGTPAFDAGIEEDDVIVAVEGKPFECASSPENLARRSALDVKRPTGKTVSLHDDARRGSGARGLPVEANGGTLTTRAEGISRELAWGEGPARSGKVDSISSDSPGSGI